MVVCLACRAVLEKLHKAIKPGGIVVIAFEWFWDAGVFPQQSVEHIGEVRRPHAVRLSGSVQCAV